MGIINHNQTVLSLIGIFVLCIVILCGTALVIKLYRGCSFREALRVIQDEFGRGSQCHLETDAGFLMDANRNVRSILGERRFNRLCEYENADIAYPLIYLFEEGRLPCIAITVDRLVNRDERKRIENVMVHGMIRRYLLWYGYKPSVFYIWQTRADINKPEIRIYYARSEEEEELLRLKIQNYRNYKRSITYTGNGWMEAKPEDTHCRE